ncbi:hypothetical protein LK07_27620 [Streptomyces pluripotens]|uniref:PLL-like beta propeller domain-containing protein n=1 Tax=Streptomyces pluripotens TaxID=1355015 RepID=A0A221P4I1_9ACTN|nr:MULTISPECIES: hypothetical protein [Streptomyces]ARP72921.1 hypothetical protein LK06_026460 [Streptomyces pluripotens]ASN27169.1 hypothetical protein LK07_27620 [Streptomyces pluripotens]KIE28869.1 hypothetical protein LK08_00300 [Streptomyces sp. MUSC 125]MCH0561012.1 hypothetical protein [Streptomyces sp. MUM 16J]
MNGDWLIRGRDGRLSVYQLSGDAVLCRSERGRGGAWTAPRTVGGEQKLHPVLGIGQGIDGYAHLVSWRPMTNGESGLVHSAHFRPHLGALDWNPVGHPRGQGRRTGAPAVAVDAQGRAHVFVPGEDGTVSLLAQKEKGGWEPWRELKGSSVQDCLAAATGESGRVELYATVPDGILHWRQQEPGAQPVLQEALQTQVRPGTLYALATSADSTTVFYTDVSGDLCAWRPGDEPAVVVASAGPGPVSAVRCDIDGHDCTLLAQRSASGRVAFAAYPTELESAGAWWTESGPQLSLDATVSLTTDDNGRVVAATSSPSTGQLLLTARKDEPGLALEAWRQV